MLPMSYNFWVDDTYLLGSTISKLTSFMASRQTIPKLRLCLHPDPRSRAPGPALLLGRSDLQLRLFILGNSSESADPASANCQVHGRNDLDMGHYSHCTCGREELCRGTGFAFLAWDG